jgi:hypothetical protein
MKWYGRPGPDNDAVNEADNKDGQGYVWNCHNKQRIRDAQPITSPYNESVTAVAGNTPLNYIPKKSNYVLLI